MGRGSGWAAMRPVLVALLLVVDAFAVAVLAISHRHGWLPPFIAFGSLLVGLIWLQIWTIRHRKDDDLATLGRREKPGHTGVEFWS